MSQLGPLERYQLKYLFENEKKLLNLLKNDNIDIKMSYFFLSFGLINTLSREDIKILNDNFEQFKRSDNDKPSIYIFGIYEQNTRHN